ncbi:MAG TPA: hypothetical protein P5084_02505 [Paludibacter sp.]|nr:hypothetical protein [Paludibacter sp.]
MRKYFRRKFYLQFQLLVIFIISSLIIPSCDVYNYDNEEPEWLGASIYEYLANDSNFSTVVKLIDDLNYSEVLKLTGSKTLFVANDSAFTEFFKSNQWGVHSYEALSLSQKKILFNYAMINNAYVLDVFSNYYSGGSLFEGTAMRRQSALNDIDSIPFDTGDKLPSGVYWDSYRSKGMHLIKDYSTYTYNNNTSVPIVFFTEDFLKKYAFTDEDFSVLTGGLTRVKNDVHLFNNKVIKSDIVCKNGYVNVLNSVLIPPSNMAQYIKENAETKIFSKLLDRFSAPYYDAASTMLYKQLKPGFTDSIFAKIYFASNGGVTRYPLAGLPAGKAIPTLLAFNPGWNSYNAGAVQADMAAMFVPSDAAMNNYFNSGVGEILRSRYHYWDSVPDDIILPFIKRHMRTSLIESVPSKFDKMVDAENYGLPVSKSHIEGAHTCVNGEVYITNEVYPPVDYISVYSPVLLSENAKIMNWAINISESSVDGTQFAFYKLYLNSLVSTYSLFIPTDQYFNDYFDPIAYGQDVKAVLKFWFNKKTSAVNATVYKISGLTGTYDPAIDSVDVITSPAFLKNRLWNILDSHIVVGNVESGKDFYITKANDIIKVNGTGANMTVQGGGDISNGVKCNVVRPFEQYNGKTYFIDKPIQPSLTSVYKKLNETPQFEKFYKLLSGVPDTCIQQIFAQQGIDYRIKFFNAYRYTVYVPTNEKIDEAISTGKLKSWDDIYAIKDKMQQYYAIQKMIRFLRYHFQDNAVFVNQNVNELYQSATIKNDATVTNYGTAKNKYYKIGVVGNGNNLTLTSDTPKGDPLKIAHVIKENGLYDIVVKDYIFAKIPSAYKNVDGTGSISGTAFNTSLITTSASAVIHQIDNILSFE